MLKQTLFLMAVMLCAGCGETTKQKSEREQREGAEAARGKEELAKWYVEHPKTVVTTVPPGSSQGTSLSKDQVRVLRENRAGDDSSREYIFRAQIKALGQRCDSVDSAIMGEPGEWEISCAPGYEYRISYDENGTPTRAQRAQ